MRTGIIGALAAASVLTLVLPVEATAQGEGRAGIEGSYRIEGMLPGQRGAYKGEVQVKRTGETYAVGWRIGNTQSLGTGMLVGDQFTVIYQRIDGPGRPGVAVYEIKDGRIGEGVWTELGSHAVGTERWEPSDRL